MKNPWLKIKASDYEGHMNLPEVDQLSFLGNIFKTMLDKYDGRSVLYLGCATGNGLEHISDGKTHKLTAIDINSEYLDILRNRYGCRFPQLETIEADLNEYQGNGYRYSLIFAGLLFEYLDPVPLLNRIAIWLETGGVLVVVLQCPNKSKRNVSDTPYASLKLLEPIMNLISEEAFKRMAADSGLKEHHGKTIMLESGKAFYIGAYTKIV